jgi:hypothetical protein
LSGSPVREQDRTYKEYEDFESEDDLEMEEGSRPGRWERQSFPHFEKFSRTTTYNGTLSSGQDDRTSLVLSIKGTKVDFQLSLVSFDEVRDGDDMAELFDQYLVDFDRFLEDESVVQDPRLVMRWGRHQYVASCFSPSILRPATVTYGRKTAHQSWMLSYSGVLQHSLSTVKISHHCPPAEKFSRQPRSHLPASKRMKLLPANRLLHKSSKPIRLRNSRSL